MGKLEWSTTPGTVKGMCLHPRWMRRIIRRKRRFSPPKIWEIRGRKTTQKSLSLVQTKGVRGFNRVFGFVSTLANKRITRAQWVSPNTRDYHQMEVEDIINTEVAREKRRKAYALKKRESHTR